jgi:hypothetical protein
MEEIFEAKRVIPDCWIALEFRRLIAPTVVEHPAHAMAGAKGGC